MKKKLLSLLLALTLVLTLGACGGGNESAETGGEAPAGEQSDQKVALVLGIGGLGDQGYNDLVYEGVSKAKEDFGVEFDHAEPKQISDFELIFRDLATSGDYAVIIGVGFDQVDPMTTVAGEFPDQKFAIIDGNVEAPNVASYSCKEEEGSFLVGAIAGLMTKEGNSYNLEGNEVGFVGATEIPLLVKFQVGYEAGVRYTNNDANVQVGWVSGNNPFSDTSTAKEIALSQNSQGASIVYHAAGGSGLGVFEAAKDGDFYAIGCNSNQNPIDPDHIVASMLKKVDTSAYEIVKAAAIDDNLIVGEVTILGIPEDGVGYTVEGSNVELTEEDLAIVEDLREKIASGELVIPATVEEVEPFLSENKL